MSPDPPSTVGLGVIGLGYWGPNLVRALAEMPDVHLAWLCDVDPARVERARTRYPSASGTTRVEHVLSDPSVDAVLIATPVFTHYELTDAALRAGKHVFVEKPLAASADEAGQLVELAQDSAQLLMCGHTFLYSPPVRRVKELLEESELGEIFFVTSSRVNLGLHQRDVSVVWDLGPHDFSILLYWLEELPDSVRTVGRDSIVPGIADVAFVTLTFASGIVANVELSWLAPSKLRRTVLVGKEKMVIYEDGIGEPVKVFDHGVVYRDPETFGEYHLSYRTGDVLVPKVDTQEPLILELAEFLEALRAGASMSWNVALAEDVVRLTEAAEESLRRGGAKVPIHGPGRFQDRRPDRRAALEPVAKEL